MRKILSVSIVLLLATFAAAQTAEVRPQPEDVAALASASAARISPDGTSVLYVLTTRTQDPEAKPSDDDLDAGWNVERQLYLAAPGSAARQLTFAEERPSDPRWSPDGSSIAFLRKKDKRMSLMVMSLAGGEARPVDTGELEPSSLAWAPDGKSIAFTATPPLTEDARAAKWRRGGATLYGEEWRSSQLFVVSLSEAGVPRQVTQGARHVSAFEWSPDGTRFAVVTAESGDPYFVYSFQTVEVILVKDGAVAASLEVEPKVIGTIHWSPDGNWVAYEKGVRTLSLLNVLSVRCVTAACKDDPSRNAARKLDPTLAGFSWSADSKSVIAHLYEKTASVFYELSSDGSSARNLSPGERVVFTEITRDRSGRYLAFNSATVSEPSSPTIFDTRTGEARVAAQINPQVARWVLGKHEIVRWKNPEGVELEGVLTVTPRAKPGEASPLVVIPHGGPDSVTSNAFFSWAHLLAAHGFSVLQPNYRGGFGYGYDFYAANRGRLGEIEFMDIESGVDSLIAAGKADPKRLFYGGWSWGGYLTAYTIGHTNRYRAAVAGAAVVDTVYQYVTSDINHGVAAEWEYRGLPWTAPDNFARANPMHSLAKVRTPTLVIHGDADDRVPLPNGQYLYRALKDIGTPVRMFTYPGQPHGFTSPAHTAHMLDEWLAWYESHSGAE